MLWSTRLVRHNLNNFLFLFYFLLCATRLVRNSLNYFLFLFVYYGPPGWSGTAYTLLCSGSWADPDIFWGQIWLCKTSGSASNLIHEKICLTRLWREYLKEHIVLIFFIARTDPDRQKDRSGKKNSVSNWIRNGNTSLHFLITYLEKYVAKKMLDNSGLTSKKPKFMVNMLGLHETQLGHYILLLFNAKKI